ncbi:MAG: hypothetical protein Kow002_01520 [Anaerolineales bacterium]
MSKKITILLAISALMIAALACSGGSAPPEPVAPPVENPPQTDEPAPPPAPANEHISNARMAYDQAGDRPTDVFGPSDDFYLVFDIKDGRQGEVFSTKWYGEENPGDGPTYMFYEQTFPLDESVDSSEIYFNLYNTESDWPVGQYKVELFNDGVLVLTEYFEVR